jgi:hypothetical protein
MQSCRRNALTFVVAAATSLDSGLEGNELEAKASADQAVIPIGTSEFVVLAFSEWFIDKASCCCVQALTRRASRASGRRPSPRLSRRAFPLKASGQSSRSRCCRSQASITCGVVVFSDRELCAADSTLAVYDNTRTLGKFNAQRESLLVGLLPCVGHFIPASFRTMCTRAFRST